MFALQHYSCDKIVDFDIDEIDSELVVNSFFTPDSLLTVSVSLPLNLNESVAKDVNDACVVIKRNSIIIDSLIKTSDGLYQTNEKIVEAGSIYEIEISSDGLNTVFATDTVPYQKVIPKNINVFPNVITDEEGVELNEIQFSIDDPANEKNYYEFKIIIAYPDDDDESFSSTFIPYITSNDQVITIEGDIYYYPETLLFCDDQFNGTQKTISIYFGNIDCAGCPAPEYIVQLRTISYTYYSYKKKLLRHLANQSGDIWDGEANPVKMYSNIENGYGIFASYYQSIDTIKSY